MTSATHPSLKVIAAVLLIAAMSARGEPTLSVDLPSAQFEGQSRLGEIELSNLGLLTLTARRDGTRIIVVATDAGGQVLGRGESVAGLGKTVLHVRNGNRLDKLVVLWAEAAD